MIERRLIVIVYFSFIRVFVPLENFSLMEAPPLPVKGCKFWPMLDQDSWPLSSEGSLACHMHLLWHGASVYNGHLREPVTLTPIAERLALELLLPVFTTQVCQAWDSNTVQSHHRHHVITPLLSHYLTIASLRIPVIVIAPSSSHHRVIAPSTKTRSWCDGVIVNYMALSGFHTYLIRRSIIAGVAITMLREWNANTIHRT